jgi:putative Mg2+ transporter-C (MgtC) family protein
MEGVWQEILEAVRADFSDLPSLAQVIQISLRLVLAALLGSLLGYERERAGQAAGLRTHMLVALGAAFFVLIPQQAGMPIADLSRVLQGVITGMGFLGAGAILKSSERGQIRGLTTAAGIWLTAAVGIAAGMGREASAILGASLALLILSLDRWVGWKVNARRKKPPPPATQTPEPYPKASAACTEVSHDPESLTGPS